MNELRLALKQQNYPVNVIEKGIDKAMKLRKIGTTYSKGKD